MCALNLFFPTNQLNKTPKCCITCIQCGGRWYQVLVTSPYPPFLLALPSFSSSWTAAENSRPAWWESGPICKTFILDQKIQLINVGRSDLRKSSLQVFAWIASLKIPPKTVALHNTHNNKNESSLMSTQTVCPYVCLCLCACKWEKINVMKIPSKCSETLASLTCP